MFLSVVVCSAWLTAGSVLGRSSLQSTRVHTPSLHRAHSAPQETRPTSRVFIDLEKEPEPSLQEDAQLNIVQSH